MSPRKLPGATPSRPEEREREVVSEIPLDADPAGPSDVPSQLSTEKLALLNPSRGLRAWAPFAVGVVGPGNRGAL